MGADRSLNVSFPPAAPDYLSSELVHPDVRRTAAVTFCRCSVPPIVSPMSWSGPLLEKKRGR